jgi:hypothetical protein
VGYCEYCDAHFGSTEGGGNLEHLRDFQLLKDSASRNYLVP